MEIRPCAPPLAKGDRGIFYVNQVKEILMRVTAEVTNFQLDGMLSWPER
jgi:hypothetical protein